MKKYCIYYFSNLNNFNLTGPRFNSNFNTHGLPTPPTARSPASGIGPTPTPNPHPSLEQTRLALLKMFGAAPPGSLPNLPPLPGSVVTVVEFYSDSGGIR